MALSIFKLLLCPIRGIAIASANCIKHPKCAWFDMQEVSQQPPQKKNLSSLHPCPTHCVYSVLQQFSIVYFCIIRFTQRAVLCRSAWRNAITRDQRALSSSFRAQRKHPRVQLKLGRSMASLGERCRMIVRQHDNAQTANLMQL